MVFKKPEGGGYLGTVVKFIWLLLCLGHCTLQEANRPLMEVPWFLLLYWFSLVLGLQGVAVGGHYCNVLYTRNKHGSLKQTR